MIGPMAARRAAARLTGPQTSQVPRPVPRRAAWLYTILAATCIPPVAAQVATFSVRNQPVDQVLLAFAERTGVSIVPDATVTGSVSLVLHDSSPEQTVREIASAAGLFVDDRHGVWHLSRVRVHQDGAGRWIAESRGASLATVVGRIARKGGMFVNVSAGRERAVEITLEGDSPQELLQRLAQAVELELREAQGVYRLVDSGETVPVPPAGAPGRITIAADEARADRLQLTAAGASRRAVLREVADHLGHSLVIVGDLSSVVPSVELEATELGDLLQRIAAALGIRLYHQDDTLFATDSYDSDGLQRFFHTAFLPVEPEHHEALTAAVTRVPDLAIAGEVERGLLISGMEASLQSARELARLLEASRDKLRFFEYRPRATAATTIVEALTVAFDRAELEVAAGGEIILGWVPQDALEELEAAAHRWDTAIARHRYRCRFADPATVLEFVSAHFTESRAAITADGTAVSLEGPPATHLAVQRYLKDVDRPRRQLRFDLCIIQYQVGHAVQHGIDLSAEHTPTVALHQAPITGSGAFNGLLQLQFDIISRLGYQAAVAISDELTSNRARLVLDTSLKALHRETARLENSSTFRYRDVLGEEDEASWRSVVREINSGLEVEVTGTLHDDRSITVDVRVELSRQGADVSRNGNPPPTSQRVVESTVRVHPGEPVVIGGLLQQEDNHSEHRFPLLGRIPLLRHLLNRHDRHSEENELVLYLSAFPEPLPSGEIHRQHQIQRLRELVHGGFDE